MSEFSFFDFVPDDTLRFQANRVLDRLTDISPYGSAAVAMLKKENDLFRCSVEIYSKHGPFIASSAQPTPLLALRQIQRTLSEKLLAWSQSRSVREKVSLLTTERADPSFLMHQELT